MEKNVILLGKPSSGLDRVAREVERAGFTFTVIEDIEDLPPDADTVSGQPLFFADADALLALLKRDDSAERLEGAECVILGDEAGQHRLSQWMDLSTCMFLNTPVDTQFLRELLEDFADDITSSRVAIESAGPPIKLDRFGHLYGSSSVMHRLFRDLRRAAASDATLCLYGESGTGKELAARSIHQFSNRSEHPFRAINCSAIPRELFESELFGHEKGAFSGAVQSKAGLFENVGEGTLLLDEITEMDKDMQAKLLRVLETGRFQRVGGSRDIECRGRVLAATNRRPADAVQFGRLREDLYYRISQLEIHMPALRERTDDIPMLARLFAREYGRETGKKVVFEADAERLLQERDWPGNVRQLWNVVQLACTVGAGVVTAADLQHIDDGVDMPGPAGEVDGDTVAIAIGSSLEDAERKIIEATMEHFGGSKQRVADTLGISLRTLYNRLKNYSGS